jgi:hypothetical protein
MQRRIDRSFNIGGESGGSNLLSAEAAGRQMQDRIDKGLASNATNRLRTMSAGFKIATEDAAGFGSGLNRLNPHFAMLASRLTGIDPVLLRVGFRFGVFVAAAAAGLALVNKSIESVRSNLKDLELVDKGKLGTLGDIFLNTWETDTGARQARRAGRADTVGQQVKEKFAAPDWEKEFEKYNKPLLAAGVISAATYAEWYEAAKKTVEAEADVAKKREQWARADADEADRKEKAENELEAVRSKNRWETLSQEQQRAELVKEIADLEKEISRWGLTGASEQAIEAEKKKGQLAGMDRQIATEAAAERRKTAAEKAAERGKILAPWIAEMQKPAGFAATTLSNSLEGAQSVALAATAKERQEATQRAAQQQIQLLESIDRKTGNSNTETWSG